MRFQPWDKIERIFSQYDVAGIYFIMDRAELLFSFYSMSGGGSDICRSKQIAPVFLSFLPLLFASCGEIYKYLSHP